MKPYTVEKLIPRSTNIARATRMLSIIFEVQLCLLLESVWAIIQLIYIVFRTLYQFERMQLKHFSISNLYAITDDKFFVCLDGLFLLSNFSLKWRCTSLYFYVFFVYMELKTFQWNVSNKCPPSKLYSINSHFHQYIKVLLTNFTLLNPSIWIWISSHRVNCCEKEEEQIESGLGSFTSIYMCAFISLSLSGASWAVKQRIRLFGNLRRHFKPS